MAKRSYDEIENINDVDGLMSSTSIHGAVETLSNLWPQPQAALFTCTTVSYFGHVFLSPH